LWNIVDGTREYIHTSSYTIAKICGNMARGLVAFCEGGTSPQAFVYSVEPRKLLFTLSDLTELELADLAFSKCGSRLYALSRATSKRLQIFSTKTGQVLPGCQLNLPLRFDKIAVYPGHKDSLALVRSSSVRIVTVQKSYETYIARLLPSSVPSDMDMAVSAYAWTNTRQFMFATRQGAILTLDGTTGSILHAVQAEQPITSIAVTATHIMTAHIGNQLKFWTHNPHELATAEEGLAMLQQMSPMEGGFEPASVYALQRVADLDGMCQDQPLEHRLMGQVANVQLAPEGMSAVLTTAEGEVWSLTLPQPRQEHAQELPEGEAQEVPAEDSCESQEMKLDLISWFHTHPVSDTLFLASARTCASCDESGRLRIWDLMREDDPKGFRTLCFSSALSSLASDADGQVLLVGTDTGCIHLVSCSSWKQAHVIDTIRISEAGVAKLCSVTNADTQVMYIAAALFNNKIAFLAVNLAEPKLLMYGFTDLHGTVDDICFHREEFEGEDPKLLVAGCSLEHSWTCLWLVGIPPPDYEATTADLPREVCPIWSMKLSSTQRLEDKPTAVASASKDLVIVGFGNGAIKSYPCPTSVGAPTAKLQPMQASDTLPPHEQFVTKLIVSREGALLVSASMDGSIRKIFLNEADRAKSPPMQKSFHNPYNGGVAQVATDASNGYFLSTGGSDGVVVWSDPRSDLKLPAALPQGEPLEQGEGMDTTLVVNVDDKDNSEFPVWVPVSDEERAARAEEADDPEISALALAQRRALSLEIENLRKKLRLLVEQNATCPELEQLDRSEFCVDIEERDLIAAKTKERCDALRALIERENVARQMIRDRLIKEFWDPMRGKGCQITSLSSNLSVSNYPERIVSEEEQSRLRKLRLIRQAEHMEMDMLKGPGCPPSLRNDTLMKADKFTNGQEGYIVNWWDTAATAKTGENAFSDQKFLYEPFELLTNARRRLQVHILQALAAEYRQSFNELFKKCQGDKKDIINQIKEKVTRTRAILGELQIEEKVPEPELHDSEDHEAVLNVKDKEIKVEKWLSPEERKAIEDARLKEEERLRQLRENDAGQRALNQMMGGTLKTKKDLSALEITLDKEPWMDEIPEDEMTEVQLAALKDFREKEKTLADEQDKYRKQLDAELKRLRTEVQDLTQQFELVLKELHHQRFAHDAKFFCQELYCVRLQLALLQSVEDSHVLKQSTQEVEEARVKLAEADGKLEEFSAEVAAKKAKQDDRVRHEREIASAQNFRQHFATSGLEPEAVGSLLQLFRKKKPVGAEARRSTTQPSFEVVVAPGTDPYADLGTVDPAASKGPEEDIALECPEGIDDENFERMLQLRRDRLQAETEVQQGAAVLQEMNGFLAYLQKERDDLEQAHKQLQNELEEHVELMRREEYDIEILFKLKQGQVEVPQAAVVTDYSDAVVIDNEVVESRNRRILELGKEKVGTLGVIKEFRKKLSLIQWEYKMLQMQTTDLEERTKDVHMLRVTKGLQSLLKGGEEGRNKADADLLERKIEHLNSTMAQKEAAMRKQYTVGSHAAKLRKNENSMLEKKLRELQQNVIQREHIRRLRAPQGGAPQGAAQEGEKPRIIGGGGRIEENEATIRAAQTGFREVKTKQKLMDAAKRHTEEIELLTKELDRLRQKTFPSFVQLHEDRGSPDFR